MKSPTMAKATHANASSASNPAAVRKHSVLVAGHATSVSLEEVFWQEFRGLAARRNTPLYRLISEIDQRRHGNLSSAIRVYVLEALRDEGR